MILTYMYSQIISDFEILANTRFFFFDKLLFDLLINANCLIEVDRLVCLQLAFV